MPLGFVAPPAADPPPAATAQQVCAKLDGTPGKSAPKLAATLVAATDAAPAYCKVNGTLESRLNFELRFPDGWNGKLVYHGSGGLSGVIPAVVPASLKKGYVQIASDDGNQTGAKGDASWALNDPRTLQLWGSQSVSTVMPEALEIVRTAYGKGPARSYFEGCSTGGRQALMAAQRSPHLFDGVISGDPSYAPTALLGFWSRAVKLLAAPGGALPEAKLKLLSDSAIQACDAFDGIADGIVSNPAACTRAVFDPASLRCASGNDEGNACLSDAQLASVKALSTRIEFAGGSKNAFSHAGFPLTGHEDKGWPAWITGAGGNVTKSNAALFLNAAVPNIIARDPSANPLTYAFERNEKDVLGARAIVDAADPDIRPFLNGGRKLLLWHAGSDPAYPAENTADYYRAMSAAVGKDAAEAGTRFYVPPGVLHCAGGPGADKVDFLQALDDWVTQGTAPETLAATKVGAAGAVELARPLCRYPRYARYVGPANDAAGARLASNYACTSPN